MRAKFDVGQLLAKHSQFVWTHPGFGAQQRCTMDALAKCRTAALGGHVDACSKCGHQSIAYNSCRNRHCTKCQGVQRERWILARERELLPTPYFHLVFTIPAALNSLCMHYPKIMYDALFAASWKTVQAFASDHQFLGAKTAMTAILHTWGQNLSLHPHIHAIIPGGGLTPSGKWKTAKANGKFLFPVKAMSTVFRAKFMAIIRPQLNNQGVHLSSSLNKKLFQSRWVVFAKRPFAGPKQVLEYIGRYTHKVAISNHRIKKVDQQTITFSYRDYKQAAVKKLMTLQQKEFIRRFALHILPYRFVRIRHFGFLAGRYKVANLNQARKELALQPIQAPTKLSWQDICINIFNFDPTQCPNCQQNTMARLYKIPPIRHPPVYLSKTKTHP